MHNGHLHEVSCGIQDFKRQPEAVRRTHTHHHSRAHEGRARAVLDFSHPPTRDFLGYKASWDQTSFTAKGRHTCKTGRPNSHGSTKSWNSQIPRLVKVAWYGRRGSSRCSRQPGPHGEACSSGGVRWAHSGPLTASGRTGGDTAVLNSRTESGPTGSQPLPCAHGGGRQVDATPRWTRALSN